MQLDYFYCYYCGYEAFDVWVPYSRTTVSEDWYYCPCCGNESCDTWVEDE